MAIKVLKHRSDYLHAGSPNNPRLYHVDSSDQIQILSPQVGQGYSQTIPLREGLSLAIIDHSVHETVLSDMPAPRQSLELSFGIVAPATGFSFIWPNVGQKRLGIWKARQRRFQVEVIFTPPEFVPYGLKTVEHYLPQDQAVVYKWANQIYRHQRYPPAPSPQAALRQILSGSIAPPPLSNSLEWMTLGRLLRPMTPEMHRVVSQILDSPYGGRVRRVYLEQKALELIELKFKELDQRRSPSYPLNFEDVDGIYQAAEILIRGFQNPPSIENLARQVGLNRLKLNQGFHYIYGTTPFRYLRNVRLARACHLLATSDLSVETIAYQVGYNSRTSFASAFCQAVGLSPKAFQLHSRPAQLQCQSLSQTAG